MRSSAWAGAPAVSAASAIAPIAICSLVMTCLLASNAALFLRAAADVQFLAGVLHVRDRVDHLDADAVALLHDLLHVDVLHDVAGLGVDRDRAARACELPALQSLYGLVAVDPAVQRFHDVHDGGHRVPALHGEEIGPHLV